MSRNRKGNTYLKQNKFLRDAILKRVCELRLLANATWDSIATTINSEFVTELNGDVIPGATLCGRFNAFLKKKQIKSPKSAERFLNKAVLGSEKIHDGNITKAIGGDRASIEACFKAYDRWAKVFGFDSADKLQVEQTNKIKLSDENEASLLLQVKEMYKNGIVSDTEDSE